MNERERVTKKATAVWWWIDWPLTEFVNFWGATCASYFRVVHHWMPKPNVLWTYAFVALSCKVCHIFLKWMVLYLVNSGYGLTETCGGATLADSIFIFGYILFCHKILDHDLSTGSVGPPLRCCEIMLREWSEGIFWLTIFFAKYIPERSHNYIKVFYFVIFSWIFTFQWNSTGWNSHSRR